MTTPARRATVPRSVTHARARNTTVSHTATPPDTRTLGESNHGPTLSVAALAETRHGIMLNAPIRSWAAIQSLPRLRDPRLDRPLCRRVRVPHVPHRPRLSLVGYQFDLGPRPRVDPWPAVDSVAHIPGCPHPALGPLNQRRSGPRRTARPVVVPSPGETQRLGPSWHRPPGPFRLHERLRPLAIDPSTVPLPYLRSNDQA